MVIKSVFFNNLKKIFAEELCTKNSEAYSKEESDSRYVSINGDAEIDGNMRVNSIETKSGIEIF